MALLTDAQQGHLADQGVFIPALSKALAPFLDENVLEDPPVLNWTGEPGQDGYWLVENHCPHHITAIISVFYSILCCAQSPRGTDDEAITILQTVAVAPATPEVVLEVLKGVDVKGTFNSMKIHLTSRLDPTTLLQGSRFVPRGKAWIIACAIHPSAGLTKKQASMVMRLLDEQPRYGAQRGDFVEQRATSYMGPFPALTVALMPFLAETTTGPEWDEVAVAHVCKQFTRIAMVVADTWNYWQVEQPDNAMPHYGVYQAGVFQMDSLWDLMVADPFSPVPHYVRQVLVNVNVKGAWDMFWYQSWHAVREREDYWESGPPLTFVLFDWLVGAAIDCQIDHSGSMCQMVKDMDDSRYASWLELVPRSFRPDGLETEEIPWEAVIGDVREDEEVDFDDFDDQAEAIFFGIDEGIFYDEYIIPDNLEDVKLVPIGPRIETLAIVTRVAVAPADVNCTICLDGFGAKAPCMALNACNHLFHFDCIDELANSGTAASSKCPYCRAEICERRQMGPASQEEEVEMGNTYAANGSLFYSA